MVILMKTRAMMYKNGFTHKLHFYGPPNSDTTK